MSTNKVPFIVMKKEVHAYVKQSVLSVYVPVRVCVHIHAPVLARG